MTICRILVSAMIFWGFASDEALARCGRRLCTPTCPTPCYPCPLPRYGSSLAGDVAILQAQVLTLQQQVQQLQQRLP
jgi:hypothetical protein